MNLGYASSHEEVVIVVRLRAFVQVKATQSALRNVRELKPFLDNLSGDLLLRLEAEVAQFACERIEVPATAWQHVKSQYFPQWYLKRWPVKMRRIQVYHVCPHIEIPENDSDHISFLKVGSNESRR